MAHLFADVVEELIEVKAHFFSLYVDENAIHTLEIPAAFTKETGWPGTSDCILVTSITSMKQWPVLVNRKRGTIVSIGEGWTEFLHDQGIEVGKFLVFEVVDDQCLVVAIYPPESESKFKKTLKATHTRPYKSARLDIPTAFWRDFGADKFDGVIYTLRGPSLEAMVKFSCHCSPTQTFSFFASGWLEYVTLNNLKKGDTLSFSLTAPRVFHMTKS